MTEATNAGSDLRESNSTLRTRTASRPQRREYGADLLRAVGFEARSCYDGPSALLEAASFLPNMCQIDLNMPGMDGDELAIKLREQAAGVPLVLVAVTAASNERDSNRIRDAGFDMHFIKPVDPHQLVLVVDTLWRAWHRWVLKSSAH